MLLMKMYNNRKWLKQTKEHLKKLDFKGQDFYTFDGSIIDNNYTRRIMKFRHVIENRDKFKLDKTARKQIYKMHSDASNEGKAGDCAQIMLVLESLDDLTYWEDELFEVANAFVLMKGEPLDTFSTEHTKRKRHLFETDENVRLFFCHIAHEYLRSTIGLPKDFAVMDYLENKGYKMVRQMYQSLMRRK